MSACLAQLVERTAFNRMVVGSSPTVGKDNLYYKAKKNSSLSSVG